MLKNWLITASVLSLLAPPCVAQAAPRVAGPYPIARQPGETLAQALHRAIRLARQTGFQGPRAAQAQNAMAAPPVAPPSILSGKILTPTIDVQTAPATPQIQIKYTSPGYLNDAFFEFISPSGYQYLETYYYTQFPASKGGTATFENGDGSSPSLYTPPGAWTLDYAGLYDFDGQYAYYSGSQLASLFPSTTLNVTNNGTPDTTPPSVSAGKLLTRKVKLSSALPVFKAQMTVADDLSGVGNYYGATALILLTPDGSNYYYAWDSATAPVLSGTVTTGIDFADYTNIPTGTWTIAEYAVCDVVNNCLFDGSPTDIQALFGTTTFSVVP